MCPQVTLSIVSGLGVFFFFCKFEFLSQLLGGPLTYSSHHSFGVAAIQTKICVKYTLAPNGLCLLLYTKSSQFLQKCNFSEHPIRAHGIPTNSGTAFASSFRLETSWGRDHGFNYTQLPAEQNHQSLLSE